MIQQIKSFFGKTTAEQDVRIRAGILAIAVCFSYINNNVNGQLPTGTFRDRDGNSYSSKMMPDNKNWMTANLSINIPGSYAYDSSVQQRAQYGRLYTWKSAQEGCKLLGEVWRLPTNEEWQKMAKWYGGVRGDSDDDGKAAYQALINGGNAAFNAIYGGSRDSADGSYARVDAHGFYWTATESDVANAWFYNFGKNGKILNRHQDGQKHMAISVRCIKDIGNEN